MSDSFFIVFDTCTHAAYYRDVHQVLALPEGAVIRYEYKRRLFKDDAAAGIERLAARPEGLPCPVLLMYGEKQGFVHGDKDPDSMLTVADSVFIPTRSASLEAVAIENGANRADDVLYLHLKLKGFVRPNAPPIQTLLATLEAARSLPFGDKTLEHKWISLLPASMAHDATALQSDDQDVWPSVVDEFVLRPTQFEKDVFWRVKGIFEEKNGATNSEVKLVDRGTNQRLHSSRFHRDYPLKESRRYLVEIQTHSPADHGVDVPAGSSIAMTSEDDDEGLLKLAADPLAIVPNQVDSKRFSVSTDNAIDTRFTGFRLETQVPDHTDKYPAGSECSLTFSIKKDPVRLFLGSVMMLLGTAVGGYVVGAKPGPLASTILAVLAGLLVLTGGVLLNRQLKFGK